MFKRAVFNDLNPQHCRTIDAEQIHIQSFDDFDQYKANRSECHRNKSMQSGNAFKSLMIQEPVNTQFCQDLFKRPSKNFKPRTEKDTKELENLIAHKHLSESAPEKPQVVSVEDRIRHMEQQIFHEPFKHAAFKSRIKHMIDQTKPSKNNPLLNASKKVNTSTAQLKK